MTSQSCVYAALFLTVFRCVAGGNQCLQTKWTTNDNRLPFVAFSVAFSKSYTAPNPDGGRTYNKIAMDTVLYNDNNAFNMADSSFTTPYTGVYGFHYGGVSQSGKNIRLYLFAGTPAVKVSRTIAADTGAGVVQASAYHMLKLNKGDLVYLTLFETDTLHHYDGVPSTFFSGELLHLS